jgi:hypothetical protein
MAHPDPEPENDVIDRQEEDGDYSFTFAVTLPAG